MMMHDLGPKKPLSLSTQIRSDPHKRVIWKNNQQLRLDPAMMRSAQFELFCFNLVILFTLLILLLILFILLMYYLFD